MYLFRDNLFFSKYIYFIKGNRELYLEDISKGISLGKGDKLTPLFMTKSERQRFRSIRNKNMREIESLILREIEQIRGLGATDQADRLLHMWETKIKAMRKDAYIVFYQKEVTSTMDDIINSHPLLGNN